MIKVYNIFHIMTSGQSVVALSFVILSVLISLYAFYINSNLFEKLSLHPFELGKKNRYYTLITNVFLYGDLKLLMGSMIVFLFSGLLLENLIGSLDFLLLILMDIAITNLVIFAIHRKNKGYFKLASNSIIISILVCLLLIEPHAQIKLFLGKHFSIFTVALLYFILLFWAALKKWDNISNEASISGTLLGILFAIYVVL